MTLKDLTAHLVPPLHIPYAGTTYEVQPPSKDTGLKLAAINAAGVATYASVIQACPTCGHSGSPELPNSTRELLESMGEAEVAPLALGQDVYDQMLADRVPGPHIDKFGLYALYYWTLGEATADAIFEAQLTGGGASGEAAVSGRTSTPRPGPRTASANPTRRVSTRATGALRRR
ncbi:DUF7426 family protein [Litorihabitans aurantiacus]|uniref:DUF7426 domain-containing protein n=1 Tax=Litorihabitans aurantiacus TaxID=1930061 RepID=A0AA37XEE4_9MICO|nr:hypothetical protein [Litorihabitans aurantiacus]GMA31604.1 hypothetical protein GCM10025875_15960 [Litorihabitans aurantiacus]